MDRPGPVRSGIRSVISLGRPDGPVGRRAVSPSVRSALDGVVLVDRCALFIDGSHRITRRMRASVLRVRRGATIRRCCLFRLSRRPPSATAHRRPPTSRTVHRSSAVLHRSSMNALYITRPPVDTWLEVSGRALSSSHL